MSRESWPWLLKLIIIIDKNSLFCWGSIKEVFLLCQVNFLKNMAGYCHRFPQVCLVFNWVMDPNTELCFVNDSIGNGVFATTMIPRGTIIWTLCAFLINFSPSSRFRKCRGNIKSIWQRMHTSMMTDCMHCASITAGTWIIVASRRAWEIWNLTWNGTTRHGINLLFFW